MLLKKQWRLRVAKLNLEKFKANADKIIEEKSTQGLFSESQKKLLTLELRLLEDNPFRIRLNNSYIEDLSESIEKYGQIEPITITQHKNGYQIVDGHARVEAIKLLGGDSVFCVLLNLLDNDSKFYPYILNKNSNLDDFEVAYYIERVLSSGEKEKTIQKKLSINTENYKRYNFEYNLFEILQNSEIIKYKHLKEIAKIENETLRDETLDHIVQKLISLDEVENYLLRVKDEDMGAKYAIKSDGIRVKKSNSKFSIDIDGKYLDFDETAILYDFIDGIKR